jgi:allantoin racemase
MKIMVINPNTSQSMTDHLRRELEKIKRSDTELTVTCPEAGPVTIESAYDEAQAVPPTLKVVERANREGYDAVILACFSDPGLEAAREVSDILVMGIMEASLHAAAMLGAKFTILTPLTQRIPHKEKDVRRFKLEHHLASVRALGMTVAETDADPARTRKKILEVSRLAAEEDGAEVVILGCAGMVGYAEAVTRELGLAVIDPSSVALKLTEGMVDAGLKHSKRALYAKPRPKELKKG